MKFSPSLRSIELQLRELLGSNQLYHIFIALAMFFATLALGWIIKWILSSVGKSIAKRTSNELDDLILDILIETTRWIAMVVGAYLAAEEITKATTVADITSRQLLGYAKGVIFVSFVSVVTGVFIRIADSSVKYAIEMHARKTSSKWNEGILPLINRVLNIILVTIAVIVVLHHFDQDVSSLVVSLGVGSLAIALAAQETLANMIAGFVIMLDRPFRVGDRIQLSTGETGDVVEIGIRSTKILDFDNNILVSPNSDLTKGKIINYSYPEHSVRIVLEVGVAYGTDLQKPKQILLDLAGKHSDVLRNPAPEVFVAALGESSVSLRLVGRAGSYRKKGLVETSLREQVYTAFSREGIQTPFPQRTVHLSTESHATLQNRQKRTKARR
jgi:MscS family membrane protein